MAEVNVMSEAITEAMNQQLIGWIEQINLKALAYYKVRTLADWKMSVEQYQNLGMPLEKWDARYRTPPEPPKLLVPGPKVPPGSALTGLIQGWVETKEYLVPPEPAPTAKPIVVEPPAGSGPLFGEKQYGGFYGAHPLDRTPDGQEVIAPDGSKVYKHRTPFGWFWEPIGYRAK